MEQLVYTAADVVAAEACVVPVKLDGDVARELVKRYDVKAYLTLLILDAEGAVLRRSVGYTSVADTAKFLRDWFGGPRLSARLAGPRARSGSPEPIGIHVIPEQRAQARGYSSWADAAAPKGSCRSSWPSRGAVVSPFGPRRVRAPWDSHRGGSATTLFPQLDRRADTSAFRIPDMNTHSNSLRGAVCVAAALLTLACQSTESAKSKSRAPVARALQNTPAFVARIPDHAAVTAALRQVVAETNGGFGLPMWATIVDRDGLVRLVTMSGADRGDQWPGSRVISAQKANTANAFSLPGLALSTANLFWAVQPGQSLFGLQDSNPTNTEVAYRGDARDFGTTDDPLVGGRIGGVNVFGGGLALYAKDGALLGGLGVSGDSSVADHVIAWKVRAKLGLDYVPAGVSPTNDDNMVLDLADGMSASGWGHADTTLEARAIVQRLPSSHPIGKR